MGQGHEVYASSKHMGEQVAAVPVMDLLDDCWFFHSTLFTTRNMMMLQKQHAAGSSSSSSSQEKSRGHSAMATCSSFVLNDQPQLLDYFLPTSSQQHKSSETATTPAAAPLLLRMPTLPALPQRLGSEDPSPLHVPYDLNSCYTKLRHSMSALDTYQSTTTTTTPPSSSSSSSKNSTSTDVISSAGGAGDRPPRHIIKLEKTESSRYSTIRQNYIAREAYYRKTFKEKKWRSLGDLEYIEIQGLKDLGFVLDKEGRGRHQIMNSETTGGGSCARLAGDIDAKLMIMSKAYCTGLAQRSAPPMFRWVNRKSADDMKDQLRFWAKAVASNTKLQAEGFI